MRTILILSVLLGLATGAFGVGEDTLPAPSSAVSLSAETSSGSTVLTVRDGAERPFAQPIVCFVILPPNATEPRVRLAAEDEDGPAPVDVSAGEPMVMRGLRVLPITISPARPTERDAGAARVDATLTSSIELDVLYRGDVRGAGEAQPAAALRYGHGFFESLSTLFAPEQLASVAATEEGSYLIVTDAQYVAAVQPLAAWKTEKGLTVSIVTTEETGASNRQIQDYIARRYRESANPPEFVLLVGDIEQVPGFDYHGVVSDHPYSLVDGTDFLPDLYVGRLSARSSAEVETIVSKILHYEQEPYVAEGAEWFSRALMVAADYASTTPVAVSKWGKSELLANGFAQVDSCYYPPFYTDFLGLIPGAINRGVSVVNYRGWAYGTLGWEPPHFTSLEIPALRNGWKLPVVMSFVCQNNDYTEPECFGEAWIRAGSAAAPRGAVAFIGNSEPWSHTRFNDAAAIGALKAIGRGGIRRLGSILNAAKTEWLAQFPTEIPFESESKESVEFYYHIYNLLGDPEMDLRTGPPRPIVVTYPESVPKGSNYIDVQVRETEGGAPVAGARVGVSQNGAVLGNAWTDRNGVAHVLADFDAEDSPARIVVTGAGVAPYRGEVPVSTSQTDAFLAFERFTIDDDNSGESRGNGDGIANPGETLELSVTLRNHSAAAGNVTATNLSAIDGGAEVLVAAAPYPAIPPGGEGASVTPFVVRIDPGAGDRFEACLLIEAVAETPAPGTGRSVTEMRIPVAAPALTYGSALIPDDGILNPGEAAGIGVTLRNDGSVASSTATAVLTTSTPELVAVVNGNASFPPIAVGETAAAEGSFTIQADEEAAMGQAAVFDLVVTTSEGYESRTSFSLTIGTTDHSAPLGPDSYGYFAYDITDTDYPDVVPVYDWIECSTTYGGGGTRVAVNDVQTAVVDLPFVFTYYGKPYQKVLVSDNGWISFDLNGVYDFYNWHMPNTYGVGAQIAPFWDTLNVTKTIDDRHPIVVGDGVYGFHDADRHLFVVEWSHLANTRPERDDLQTFEVILYDPAFYPVAGGDGIIDCQYKQVANTDEARMYATVGIENETEDVGLEYTYSNLYPQPAAPISSGLAIRFTTQRPRYNPFRLGAFNASRDGSAVLLSWEPADARPRGGYRIYRSAAGSEFVPITSGTLDAAARSFVDRTADPDSSYSYKIISPDPCGRETVLGPFAYTAGGSRGPRFALEARTPNPFRGSLELHYAVPRRGAVVLTIHDLSGRLVRSLLDGQVVEAGFGAVAWDGRDDEGRDLPSGIYLCKLSAGSERRSLKLTLLR